MNLHPDDLLFFNEVSSSMRRVARDCQLPIRSIEAMPMPVGGMIDCKGDCTSSGDIRLVLRCTIEGKFVEEPRTPEEVWKTAAHELAHLRFMNHGLAFQEFRLELIQALQNRKEDHKQKVIKKLVKLQAARDGEATLGNTVAAESFAAMINKMLIENELNPSDLDYARATDNDPVIEVRVDFEKYGIERKKARSAWQESLAQIVANAHLCNVLVRVGSNSIWFVGTSSHVTVAEYAFCILVRAATDMSYKEWCLYLSNFRKEHGIKTSSTRNFPETFGFREAWLTSFIRRIRERFTEARKAAVVAAPEGTSQALMRLDGALVKVRKYIDDRFSGSKRKVSALSGRGADNAAGRERGRSAADAMTLGRKGVNGGDSTRGRIG